MDGWGSDTAIMVRYYRTDTGVTGLSALSLFRHVSSCVTRGTGTSTVRTLPTTAI